MLILAIELVTKISAVFRFILWWIDSIGYQFIDNTYDLMMQIMAGFNTDVIENITSGIIRNSYMIVGIFAFLRIAVALIESIVNPDKLSDKNVGLSKIFINFVLAIVMLIVVPIIFSASRDIQKTLVEDNQVIPNLILGTNLNTGNAGEAMQLIAIKSMIKPSDRLARLNDGQYTAEANCSGTCLNAVTAWNENRVRTVTVSKFIDEYVKVGEEYVFIYDYIPFVPLVAGLFITYVLLSFTIDIGIRSVELLVLEIISPFFIVTFIDPKMAASGPFKKWLNACVKSYLSLFIRVAIISVMLLFLSNFYELAGSFNGNALTNIVLLICILIFAKKAPKWIGEMFGLSDGAGLGGLGIGAKLAGAAGVGGLIGSGLGKAKEGIKNGIKTRANDMLDRKVAKHMARHEAKKLGKDIGFKERQAIARGVGQQVKANQIGKRGSIFKRFQDAAAMGGKYVNDGYKTGKEKHMDRLEKRADNTRNNLESKGLVLDAEAKIKAAKAKADLKAAGGMLKTGKPLLDKGGKRLMVPGKDGVYANPQGEKEINHALGYPTSEEQALDAYGKNLVQAMGDHSINSSGQVVNSSGKVVAQSAAQFACQNLSDEGRAAIQSIVADNVQRTTSEFSAAIEQRNKAAATYATAQQQIISIANNNPEISTAYAMVAAYDEKSSNVAQIEKTTKSIQEKIDKLEKSAEPLTVEQEKELKSLSVELETQNKQLEEERKWLESAKEGYDSDINTLKESGIYTLMEVADSNKKVVESCNVEINGLAEKMQETVSILNDAGKEIGEYNPYNVEVNGETLNPVENINKLNTIIAMQQKNASKAKEHFEELKKVRENSGKQEDK